MCPLYLPGNLPSPSWRMSSVVGGMGCPDPAGGIPGGDVMCGASALMSAVKNYLEKALPVSNAISGRR